PVFFWGEKGPQVIFGGDSLFAALATQLLVAVSQSSLNPCASCGILFHSKRVGGRYCADCGTPAAWRLNQQQQRRRRKEARRLLATGLAPHEISRKIGSKERTVQRWMRDWR